MMEQKIFLEAKQEELHYRKQIYKYQKHLEHLYGSGILKNEKNAFYVENHLRISQYEIECLEKEIEHLESYIRDDAKLKALIDLI